MNPRRENKSKEKSYNVYFSGLLKLLDPGVTTPRPVKKTWKDAAWHPIYIYISYSYLNFLRRVALRQKPFFKGPSGKNLITAYS